MTPHQLLAQTVLADLVRSLPENPYGNNIMAVIPEWPAGVVAYRIWELSRVAPEIGGAELASAVRKMLELGAMYAFPGMPAAPVQLHPEFAAFVSTDKGRSAAWYAIGAIAAAITERGDP